MGLTKEQKKGLWRGAVTTLITIALIIGIGYVLTLRKAESFYGVKGLYAAKDVDVLFVGNSHAIVGFNAEQFEQLTSARSYNVATTNQTTLSADLLVKEALRVQTGMDTVFVETFSMLYPPPTNAGYARSLDSDSAVFRSVAHIDTKFYGMMMQPGIRRKFDAFLPLFKYHANWKDPKQWQTQLVLPKNREITYGEYTDNHTQGTRYQPYVQTLEFLATYEDFYYEFDVTGLMAANQKNWDSILENCRENGVDVVFVTLPWLPEFTAHTNTDEVYEAIFAYCKENGVAYIDFNQMNFPLDYTDFSQEKASANQHLNSTGAEKVTKWLAAWYNQYKQGE